MGETPELDDATSKIRADIAAWNVDEIVKMAREEGPTELTPFRMLAGIGYRAGLEAAAKVAEQYVSDADGNTQWTLACEQVAESIRALIPKE